MRSMYYYSIEKPWQLKKDIRTNMYYNIIQYCIVIDLKIIRTQIFIELNKIWPKSHLKDSVLTFHSHFMVKMFIQNKIDNIMRRQLCRSDSYLMKTITKEITKLLILFSKIII